MKRTRVDAVVLTQTCAKSMAPAKRVRGVGRYDPETMKAGNPTAKAGDPVLCIHHCREKPIVTA